MGDWQWSYNAGIQMKFDIIKNLSPEDRKKVARCEQPDWTDPMLAYLEHDLFFDKNWFYERKFDGERCLSFITGKTVRLRSRNNKSLNASYPEIEQALGKLVNCDCILDGEVVAFDGSETSFEKLQKRMQLRNKQEAIETGVPVYYYVFDILFVDGYDVTHLPLKSRKQILKDVVTFKEPIRYSEHRINNCESYYKYACTHGWEGLMCKDPESPYLHVRSTSWLKFKCVANQELVIGGYTDPQRSRIGFGALLLGYYDNKKNLHYAGKVGTGFNDELLASLGKKLKSLEIKKCPFVSQATIKERTAHWVKPELVGEIGFTEWTRDNKLRHPRFQGLRYDKAARDVRQEK